MPIQDRPTDYLLDFTGIEQIVISFMPNTTNF